MNENELMGSMKVSKAVAKMAIPSVISSLVTVVYNMADTFFVGQTGDPLQVAAVSLTNPIFILLMAFANMFGMGGSAVASMAMGEKNEKRVKNTSAFVTYASLIVGILFALILIFFVKPILYTFGANSQTYEMAKGYTFHVSYGAPFIIWSAASSFIVRAEGASSEAMIGSMIGTVANIVLDPVFISGLGMGAAGAAIATTIGNILASIYYLWYFMKKSKSFSVSPKYFKCGEQVLSRVCSIGFPTAIFSALMSVSTIVLNQILVKYGNAPVAAIGIVFKANMFIMLDGGWYINGKQVRQFEESFAAFCSVKHAVGVGNGTDAIEVVLRALGIGKGGLVFTVSHTAVATVAAIECAGATPVLVDVDPVTYTMSPESLAKALEAARAGRYPGKPAAVLSVHLYGCCADLDAIRAVAGDLPLIEDCAQAHGAAYKGRPAGSTGIAGTFSFYPTKNLGAVGDGGCVVTSDDALAERIRSVREYGWRTHYLSSEPGINTRLDELQAAFLNVLLPELPAKNAKRRALAELYRRELSGVPGLVLPTIPDAVEPVYHLYVVQCPDRDEVQRRLRDRGVGTAVHYPFPVHLQDAYRGSVALAPDGLPVTEAIMPRILSLPMYPELSEADAVAVAGAVRDVVSSLTKERA